MKTFATNLALLLLLLSLSIVSCKEDDMEPIDDPTTATPTAPSPNVGVGDGAFWAINSISTTVQPVIGELDTEVGTAVGILTNDNFSTFVDAGTVSVMDEALDKADNNAYTYIPGVSQPLGLVYPATYEWSIGGNGSVAAFNYTVDFAFPSLGKITSAATVTKADGYTLTCESVSQADSILFLVGGVVKTVAGDVTSVDFSASDLADISTGTNFAQVAAYKLKQDNVGGKTYYFGNETVRSLLVEVK